MFLAVLEEFWLPSFSCSVFNEINKKKGKKKKKVL